ncbi:hypothetical protein [Paenibacillus polymyxa]|uniref:hypothetical protein n=1 Tax=Paenibacillus polymyxa TaxID=1406 RepID=UPI000589C444|nr:hypothetical protein [Paenibacillus polymyxa]AJE54233.1 hypothetical protein RE92_24905 [Paenibacillus polymyxa]
MSTIKCMLTQDLFFLMNFEMTYKGVKKWFEDAGYPMNDIELFQALLFPEQLPEGKQFDLLNMVVDRYENIFFQNNRIYENNADDEINNTRDPMHQLLLQVLRDRNIHGEEDALITLGLALMKDKQASEPHYKALHSYFDTIQ